ncbi:Vigilin-like protein [Euroglyphus maynei]|uniref:Vigilin-like protein n=1 Tax=Euroglyphus maynei TaxID=6958 RepID=A0A1Y3BUY1_EURMA|nr:Vigilin-like protein [Euroglyphus maynei]
MAEMDGTEIQQLNGGGGDLTTTTSTSTPNEHTMNGLKSDDVMDSPCSTSSGMDANLSTTSNSTSSNNNKKQSAPNYDDIFPALPMGSGQSAGPFNISSTSSSPMMMMHPSNSIAMNCQYQGRSKIKSSTANRVYCVLPEELRYRDLNRRHDEISRICADIKNKTQTDIQFTHSKDGTLRFLLSGKQEAIDMAQRMLANEIKAQTTHNLPIPKEHHRLIFGKAGRKLKDIEQTTQTKIQIPKQDEKSDVIRITGTREAIDKAVHEIKSISNDAYSRSFESINVPKIYHPFIYGPFGRMLDQIQKETGAKVNIPPPSVEKDEITITGERNNVSAALERVKSIFEEKLRRCQSVSIEVKKAQHKYIVGPKKNTLNEIMEQTGVSVEMPASDSSVETIVLRGESEKLANALAVLYQKAHSETEEEIAVPGWIHRHILGPKGTKFQELSLEFPKVNVSFETDENRIKMSGPIADVQKAAQLIQQRAHEIASQYAVDEIKVSDPNHIKFIVGKNGATLRQIRDETKATIQVIGNDSSSNENAKNSNNKSANASQQFVRIEGTIESVAKAKHELENLLRKLENEVTYELAIERRFYGQIIGAKGEKIRDIRAKFNQIREDLGVRMDVQNDSDLIVITGPKDKVEKAHERIQTLQNNLSDMSQVDIMIPSKIHNHMLGSKGRNIRNIQNECGDVIITFPLEGSTSDRVTIRGAKDAVQKAKQLLVDMSNDFQTNNYREELKVRVEHHRYLIGKNGSNIQKIREQNNVRVQFSSDTSNSPVNDPDRVVIIGKKEDVLKARATLEAKIKELEKIAQLEMHVDPKYHHLFVSKRAALCKQLYDEFGGVDVSFPQQSDKNNDCITLKGPKECLEAVRQRILEIISNFDAQETIEVEIDAQHHRHIRPLVHSLQQENDVRIKFPFRSNRSDNNNSNEGGEEIVADNKANIVTITGLRENCEKAKQELLELVPVSIEVSIPFEFHRFIIGQKGVEVRDLMDRYNVNIRVPQPAEKSDIIVVTGNRTNVENARKALQERLIKLEEEKADREARSYQVTVQVDPIYHPKIIGKRGVVISSIRKNFDVQIQVPEANRNNNNGPNNDNQEQQQTQANDTITIIGYEENAQKAKEHILKLIQELKDMVTDEVVIDSRIHPRLIGSRGRSIKSIMSQFKVDIRFPKVQNGEDPDVVTISGAKDNVEECKEHLLELADNYVSFHLF